VETLSTDSPPAADLPSPDDRPDADIVIFDGQCRLCTAQIRALVWWDGQDRLAYLSLHDPRVAERYPDLEHEALMEQMVIVDHHGRRHWGPQAVRYLSRRLRRLWWLAPVLYFPGSMFLWRPLYRWIARNRYRFNKADPCDEGTCRLHR